jgi:hypothetical protein
MPGHDEKARLEINLKMLAAFQSGSEQHRQRVARMRAR